MDLGWLWSGDGGRALCYDRCVIELLAILAGTAFLPVGLGLMWLKLRPAPGWTGRQPLGTGPAEPCWTEEIGGDGRLRYARAHRPHDLLLELDSRAARGDFPVGELNTGGG